ncbi:class I SAM-dependent DNA methyltransferase [Fodinibius halophilus]|uniref:Class I SAM-dependent methyltransferase n=1 Tax=Fodinibius halophilus TaxID=1736908 RepID=A0A6M1TCH3_9BACT|nr:class I SAM-dependent methyltransferase [Fodinibius halophilus]NGP87922.1 class I SAM-dependent methyltransferase [Fodinibius halophilus]
MSNIEYPEYSKLADIYDSVMKDVNYDLWADFIDALMLNHHPNPQTIMELACGTGSLALSLDELECYDILGTDKSPQMIAKARQKNEEKRCNVDFEVMDFLDINMDRTFDIVVSVFDSINYLHSPEEVKQFLEEVQSVLGPQSLLIFDFTTPKNSIRAIDYLHNEEGYTEDGYHFSRKSTYDSAAQIHVNSFKIKKLADDQQTVLEEYQESHRQRAYTLEQMLDIIDQTAYNLVAKYSDFEFEEADENSLRITMVLRCPNTQS